MTLDPVAKILIVSGLIIVLIGIGWQFGWTQQLRIGRLPGDIYIERENMKFYFPLTTSILVSLVFALVNWLFKK
jgi:hypothetical protein